MELLSIVVPVYNAEKYLEQCLDSLVRQTYQNKEIILVDDGSSDNSPNICDSYANKYSFIRVIHKLNQGVSAARNAAIDSIRGGYIVFVDADDAVDLDGYEICIREMEARGADFVAFNLKDEYRNFSVLKKSNNIPKSSYLKGKEELTKAFFTNIGGWACNKIYRRGLIGEIRFREDIYQAEDALFSWKVIHKANDACFVNIPIYHYRYTFSSATKSADTSKFETAIIAWSLIKKDLDNENLTPLVIERWARNYIVWNIKICERMQLSDSFSEKEYSKVKDNISTYKAYIHLLGKRHQILAESILKSWRLYAFWERIFYKAKKTYVQFKNR